MVDAELASGSMCTQHVYRKVGIITSVGTAMSRHYQKLLAQVVLAQSQVVVSAHFRHIISSVGTIISRAALSQAVLALS